MLLKDRVEKPDSPLIFSHRLRFVVFLRCFHKRRMVSRTGKEKNFCSVYKMPVQMVVRLLLPGDNG